MTVGFIGAGNMARAMIAGLIDSGVVPGDVIASARRAQSLEAVEKQFRIRTALDNRAVARSSDVLFLAVKPYLYQEVIEEIRDDISPDTIIVSMTLGKSLADVESYFGKPIKLVRIMPNMAAMVLESVTAYCPGDHITEQDNQRVMELLESFGRVYQVPENLVDAVTGVAGSGPAYVFMMIEAMAQAGIKAGLSHSDAYDMAAQTVLGSAKTVIQSGLHPAVLRDQVCSPGGSTIEAVSVLEREGFKSSLMLAIDACIKKAKQ